MRRAALDLAVCAALIALAVLPARARGGAAALAAQAATPAVRIPFDVGPADAPVTLVEFVDFECERCGQLATVAMLAQREFPDQVRLVFRHRPAQEHQSAPVAYRAAVASGLQGKFWEMAGVLFGNPGQFSRPQLLAMASQLGIDLTRFATDLDSAETTAILSSDLDEAGRLGLTDADPPAFFLNGQRLQGVRVLSDFRAAIRQALGR